MSEPKTKRPAPWFFIAIFAVLTAVCTYFALKPGSKESDFQWMAGVLEKWSATTQGKDSEMHTLTIWVANCPTGLVLPKKFKGEEVSGFQLQPNQRVEFQIAKQDQSKLGPSAENSNRTAQVAGIRVNGNSLTAWDDYTAKERRQRWVTIFLALIGAWGTIGMTVTKLRARGNTSQIDPELSEQLDGRLYIGVLLGVASVIPFWISFQPVPTPVEFRRVSGKISRWEGAARKDSHEFYLKIWIDSGQVPYEVQRKLSESELAAFHLEDGVPVEVLALAKQYVEAVTAKKRNALFIGYLFVGIGVLCVILIIVRRRSHG
jgi:hypothetical protein